MVPFSSGAVDALCALNELGIALRACSPSVPTICTVPPQLVAMSVDETNGLLVAFKGGMQASDYCHELVRLPPYVNATVALVKENIRLVSICFASSHKAVSRDTLMEVFMRLDQELSALCKHACV